MVSFMGHLINEDNAAQLPNFLGYSSQNSQVMFCKEIEIISKERPIAFEQSFTYNLVIDNQLGPTIANIVKTPFS